MLDRGYRVEALVRPGSEHKVAAGCVAIAGDALNSSTYKDRISSDAFVHLVGVSNPSPAKTKLFQSVDLPSAQESIAAATFAKINHFVYVSVAHPAPVMKAYIETRVMAEERLISSGLPATILRPWYVLGPGHRWAYGLMPFYKICEWIPATRESALRCGLVTLKQMLSALVYTLENPPTGVRAIDVPQIRNIALAE